MTATATRPVRCVLPALLLAGCTLSPQPACRSGETPVVVETLYFGTATPDGRVSAADWQDFLARELTPRFPQGLTVGDAQGQWRGADGRIVHEDTHVLTLITDGSDESALATVIVAYRARFRQEAVLHVRHAACRSG